MATSHPPSELPEGDATRRVQLLGFSAFERSQFETVFRLAAARSLRYRCVTPPEPADVAVADAEDPTAHEQVARLGLQDATIWVGRSTVLPRPINMAQIVRALDALVRRGRPPGAEARRVLDELALLNRSPPTAPALQLLFASADDRLVQPLADALRRAGCLLQRVRSGAEAIEAAARAAPLPPLAVVLDTRDDGAFGYLAARSIRRRGEAAGRSSPTILLLVDTAPAVARVRGELAGADAVLALPLSAQELIAHLPIMAACRRAAMHPLARPTRPTPLEDTR